MLAQRKTTNKITPRGVQQDETQQGGPEGGAAASQARGGAAPAGGARRGPSARGACEAPPSASIKSQRPDALAYATPPPAAPLQRSPRTYSAPRRSPRQAQGLKPQAVDQEGIRLIMDEVLQKHTRQILQALGKHTSSVLESSSHQELLKYSPEAPAALVDPAEEPSRNRLRQRLQDGSEKDGSSPPKIEIERVDESEKENSRPSMELTGSLYMEPPRKGELLGLCKKITRGTSRSWMVAVEEWLEWWESLKNPKGTRFVDKLVTSVSFMLVCTLIILANTVFVAIDANRQMEHYNTIDIDANTATVKIEQYIFLCLYVVELSLRAISEGRYFFIGDNMKWNWFDMAIIVVSIIGDFIISQNSLSFLRVARILKLVKVTRTFRVLSYIGLGELQRMVVQVFSSMKSLVWCFALLAFITYVFAIFFVYSLCDLPSVDDEHLAVILDFFGSVTLTMLTLLQATTGGVDWRDVHGALSEAGNVVALCFVVYVLFFVIAVWNIITATFVEKMSKMAKPDNDALAMEDRMRNFEVAVDLKEILQKMDFDSSRTMSQAELKACLSNQAFQDLLLAHNIHIDEASTFFEMLFESGDVDSLNIDTIVAYCLRIKGQATSLDLHTMRYELATGLQRTQALLKTMEGQLAQATRQVGARAQPATSPRGRGRARDSSREPHG